MKIHSLLLSTAYLSSSVSGVLPALDCAPHLDLRIPIPVLINSWKNLLSLSDPQNNRPSCTDPDANVWEERRGKDAPTTRSPFTSLPFPAEAARSHQRSL